MTSIHFDPSFDTCGRFTVRHLSESRSGGLTSWPSAWLLDESVWNLSQGLPFFQKTPFFQASGWPNGVQAFRLA